MLKIKQVVKSYKDDNVLKDISLTIEKGEVIAIVGKSGSGKSTLLRCINRLENIDKGNIYFNGENIQKIDITELRQKIGIVFQEYNLFEHLTVLENLTIGLIKIKKLSNIEATKRAKKLLKKIGLADKFNNYPDELSGGQKQRVAIARTLVMKPQILLLDEPTSALDKEMKTEVLKLIFDLVKENMTLIIVSHEEEFVKNVADKIIHLNNGKVSIIEKVVEGAKKCN